MGKLGLFIAFLGWISSIEGYTSTHLMMIIVGMSIFILDHYLEKR